MGIENKTILITGGLGNLGSWMTHHYCSLNYNVTVLSKNDRSLAIVQNYTTIWCDVTKLEDVKKMVNPKKYDVVLHIASVNDDFLDSYFYSAIQVNTLGTRNILEILKNTFKGHFIYFSTFQVYGQYAGIITEETPLSPKNDYGNTHLFAELYLKQFGCTHNFPYSIIRLTNSYGCPKDFNSSKWHLILNNLSKDAYEKQEVILTSNGKSVRDFIWMHEVCELTEKLSNCEPTQDIFNISSQKTFSMLDIAHFVRNAYLKTYGKKIKISINEKDTSLFLELLVKSDKIRNLLNYDIYEEKFEEEAINIFKFLEQQNI